MTTTGGSRWFGLFIPVACLVALLSHDSVRSVGGRVVDTDGRPLSGVTVTLRSHGSNRSTTVITDEAGGYRLLGIEPGLYRVDAILAGYAIESEDSLSIFTSEPVELNAWIRHRRRRGEAVCMGLEFVQDPGQRAPELGKLPCGPV